MFDIGFAELLVIGVVALLVLGPEELPKVMRQLGALVRAVRSQLQHWQAQLDVESAPPPEAKNLDSDSVPTTAKPMADKPQTFPEGDGRKDGIE